MSDLEITIRLPEELVRRAKLAGIDIESATPELIDLIERRIRRKEAAQSLSKLADELSGGLTLEEIEAELAAAKEDRIAQDQARRA